MESLTNIGFKLNLTDQIVTYTVCLEGFKSISVYWGSCFFFQNTPCQVIYLTLPLSLKHASTLNICWENVSVCPLWWLCWQHIQLLSLYLLTSVSQPVIVLQLKSCIFTGNDHHRAAGWDHVFSYRGSLYDKGWWCPQQAQTDHHHWRR